MEEKVKRRMSDAVVHVGDVRSRTSSMGHRSRVSEERLTTPPPTAEYMQQLMKDKSMLSAYPNLFVHVERLLDDEMKKVRARLFDRPLEQMNELPEPQGPLVLLQQKVFVPIKEYPDYNFVGRILGPRGMTAKQLEQETGCKIMVRGRGSMRDHKMEGSSRPSWQHMDDELHVLIQVEEAENRAKIKLQRAVEQVRKLLVPAEGEDELKRKQLMELAIINGTYRPSSQRNLLAQTPRLYTPLPSPSSLCMYNAPFYHSPAVSPTLQQYAAMTAAAWPLPGQPIPPQTPNAAAMPPPYGIMASSPAPSFDTQFFGALSSSTVFSESMPLHGSPYAPPPTANTTQLHDVTTEGPPLSPFYAAGTMTSSFGRP